MKQALKRDTHLQLFLPNNQHIGHFDGEFFYPPNVLPYRVDGTEIYTTKEPAKYVGDLDELKGVSITGETLFILSE